MSIMISLRYADPESAIAFLCDVLGLEARTVARGQTGDVEHAELFWGDGAVGIGPRRPDDRFASGRAVLYLPLDDPDTHHARVAAAGAEIVMGLTDQPYGSREFAVTDPEGNVWSFGTYRPL